MGARPSRDHGNSKRSTCCTCAARSQRKGCTWRHNNKVFFHLLSHSPAAKRAGRHEHWMLNLESRCCRTDPRLSSNYVCK